MKKILLTAVLLAGSTAFAQGSFYIGGSWGNRRPAPVRVYNPPPPPPRVVYAQRCGSRRATTAACTLRATGGGNAVSMMITGAGWREFRQPAFFAASHCQAPAASARLIPMVECRSRGRY